MKDTPRAPSLYLPRRRFLHGLVGAGGAAALGPFFTGSRAAAAEGSGKTVTVSLFHTTDLHGHILPTKTYDGVENVGGLARCATQLSRWRAEQPNHMLLDIGDVYQGTMVSRATQGEIMFRLFNKLNYDAWVIGNHEFDWGYDTLVKSVSASRMPVLASNAKVEGRWVNQIEDKGNPMSKVAPFLVKEIAGFRIGVIGSVTPGLPAWLNAGLLKDFYAADPLRSVQYAITKLKDMDVDAIVLACHFGLKAMNPRGPAPDDFANRVNELTEKCRDIDVVIAGHTHRDIPSAEVNGILYTQASYYGINAGRVDLVFDAETRKLVAKTAVTKLMDASIEPDPVVLSACAGDLDNAQKELDRVIGEFTAPLPFKAPDGRLPPSLLLLTRAIRHGLEKRGVKVDAVLHGLFVDDKDLDAGPKTIADMWEIIPYENRIATAELTPAELRAALPELFRARFGAPRLDGLRAVPEGRGLDMKVTLTMPDGAPVEEGKRYVIALNAYDAQSAGRRFEALNEAVFRKEANLTLHAIESRDALIEYVSEKKTLGPASFG